MSEDPALDRNNWPDEMKSLFSPLEEKLASYLPPEQIQEVAGAYAYAYRAHQGQTRSSGEPYITHPLAVSAILADMHLDVEALMAALLHDVIEDTRVTQNDIRKLFSDTVADLVNGVTKMEKIRFSDYKEAQVANIQKMLLAMTHDTRVILIKLADRTHNMRTIGALRPDKRMRIARETLDIYAPIAYRLGISKMKNELQDLCFRAMYPYRYRVLSATVAAGQKNRMDTYNELMESMRSCFRKIGIRFQIKIREKFLATIYHKMKTDHLRLQDLLSVFGFLIIVDSVDSCYRALGQTHALFKPKQGYFKDYIALPKMNGYQGLHTTVMGSDGQEIEIHIRTEFMDMMAKQGVAAHWVYKLRSNGGMGDSSEAQMYANRWMQSLKDLMNNTSSSFDFLENVKANLFPEEIYVFDGSSKVLELPKGATPVDFAYAISADLGHRCRAAEVDHKPYPLDKALSSGQQVRIIESETPFAQPRWLDSVVTLKARQAIKSFLQGINAASSEEHGRKLLQLAMGDVPLDSIDPANIARVLSTIHISTLNELFRRITMGESNAVLVARALLGERGDSVAAGDTGNEIISNIEGVKHEFASCCFPLPGDRITGIYDGNKGLLMVHRTSCPSISEAEKNPFVTCLSLSWNKNYQGHAFFKTALHIQYITRPAILGEIVSLVSMTGAEILSITQTDYREESDHSLDILIEIKNQSHLENVVSTLIKINGIKDVSRRKRVPENRQG